MGSYSNSLRLSFQIVSMVGVFGMRYTKRAKIWVLIGAPASWVKALKYILSTSMAPITIMAKTLDGVGRGFYQTAAGEPEALPGDKLHR